MFTWSKGEYNTASQKQDDLNIMNKGENIPYMVDDIPTSVAMKLGTGGAISPKDNWGQIAQNTDSDEFTFTIGTGGGSITVRIDPLEYLRQLDVDAKIVDAQGSTVASSNMSKHRSAEFKNQALQAGTYKLVIQGGAELTPQTGFSKYSSLGYYAMEGTITGVGTTSVESIALGNYISAYPNPTQGEVNIRYASPYSQAHTELTTVTGETVFSSNELVKSIDLSGLTNGIYLLKITIDGESCIKKISKL